MQLSSLAEEKQSISGQLSKLERPFYKIITLFAFLSVFSGCSNKVAKIENTATTKTPTPVLRNINRQQEVKPQKDRIFDAYGNINQERAKLKIIDFLKNRLNIVAHPDEITIKTFEDTNSIVDSRWYEARHTPKNSNTDYLYTDFTFTPPSENIQSIVQHNKIPSNIDLTGIEDFHIAKNISPSGDAAVINGWMLKNDLTLINNDTPSNAVPFFNRFESLKANVRYEFIGFFPQLILKDNMFIFNGLSTNRYASENTIVVESIMLNPKNNSGKIFGKIRKQQTKAPAQENIVLSVNETGESEVIVNNSNKKRAGGEALIFETEILEKISSRLPQ